ncbi:MAG: hypothetical protein AB2L20_02380 [Mangrovibacterium sp.]
MQKEYPLQKFRYGEDRLTIGRAIRLVRGQEKGILTAAAREKVNQNRTERAAHCLSRVLYNDPAPGIFRHADAGYTSAIENRKHFNFNFDG